MSKNLIAIPWWSLPFFALGIYDIFLGLTQGFIMLIMTGIISIAFRLLNLKFKKVNIIPWWSVAYIGLGIFDLTDYMVNPGILLFVVTGLVVGLFCYLVYHSRIKSVAVCPNCNDKVVCDKNNRLPIQHSSGKCKKKSKV